MSLFWKSVSSAAGRAAPSALVARRSMRKYLDKPVPDDLLKQVLVEARWAPSAVNSQSTYVYVLSGKPFEKYKAELRKYSEDDLPDASDLPMVPHWTPQQEARIKEFRTLRSSWCADEERRLGLKPEPAPANPKIAGAQIHGAPLMLVLAFDKAMAAYTGCFDAGVFAMAITLAAHEHGLGTCIVASAVRYSDLVRKYVPGLEDKNVVMGIALGYPDLEAVVNRFPRTRMLPKDYVTFVR